MCRSWHNFRGPACRTAEISVPACCATRLLSVLVQTLPDSEIVGDVRNKIRNDALPNKTRKQTNSTVQTMIENSDVFESRSIRHQANVKREYFESEFWKVDRKQQRLCFRGSARKLPSKYTDRDYRRDCRGQDMEHSVRRDTRATRACHGYITTMLKDWHVSWFPCVLGSSTTLRPL